MAIVGTDLWAVNGRDEDMGPMASVRRLPRHEHGLDATKDALTRLATVRGRCELPKQFFLPLRQLVGYVDETRTRRSRAPGPAHGAPRGHASGTQSLIRWPNNDERLRAVECLVLDLGANCCVNGM